MKNETTREENQMIEHYQSQLIVLLGLPEKEHMKILVEDGCNPQDVKNRMQKIRSYLVSELRLIEKWKKNKICLQVALN